MNNKPIDLGALQDALRSADALVRSAKTRLESAGLKAEQAQRAYEIARGKFAEVSASREDAKRAVLEGARQVANG